MLASRGTDRSTAVVERRVAGENSATSPSIRQPTSSDAATRRDHSRDGSSSARSSRTQATVAGSRPAAHWVTRVVLPYPAGATTNSTCEFAVSSSRCSSRGRSIQVSLTIGGRNTIAETGLPRSARSWLLSPPTISVITVKIPARRRLRMPSQVGRDPLQGGGELRQLLIGKRLEGGGEPVAAPGDDRLTLIGQAHQHPTSITRMRIPLSNPLPLQPIHQRRRGTTGQPQIGAEIVLTPITMNRQITQGLRLGHAQPRDLRDHLTVVLPSQDHGPQATNRIIQPRRTRTRHHALKPTSNKARATRFLSRASLVRIPHRQPEAARRSTLRCHTTHNKQKDPGVK